MSDNLDPQDGLSARIHALGERPIDPALQSSHLTAMAEASAAPSAVGLLGSRLRVAGALVVGFLLGSTGLATAGALGPLQPIAATAVEAVTPLNVPNGHADDHAKKATSGEDAGTERYHGAECTGAEAGTYKNHGQYIKAVRTAGGDEAAVKAAAESDCGKPLSAVNGTDDEDTSKAADEHSSKDASTADDQGDENGKGACAGGSDNGNAAAAVGDTRSEAKADNADAGSAKPETTGKPACADDAGSQGGKPDDAGSKKPADPGSQADDHKPADAGSQADDATDDAPAAVADSNS